METTPVNRRHLIAGAGLLGSAGAQPAARSKVRDHFWLWCHEAGSHDQGWGLPAPSRITPVEAAHYMGIPNAILVRYEGRPAPPFEQYALPFRSLRHVVWSVVGAAGVTGDSEREAVLKLAAGSPNFSGVMMDDFFTGKKEGRIAALTVEELQALQRLLKGGQKKLDLWVVLYDHQLEHPVADHLKLCDVLTFWTWKAAQLGRLAASFETAGRLAPHARKVLGCYMWDYGDRKPMPIALMRRQCEQGLSWLRQGRIDGMIFLASCICDLNLETVEWTRQWIRQVGPAVLTRG